VEGIDERIHLKKEEWNERKEGRTIGREHQKKAEVRITETNIGRIEEGSKKC
jgi:hypothetical protein